MSGISLRSSAKAEWIKFRSVPSTKWCVGVTVVVTVGLGALITWAIGSHYHQLNIEQRSSFDPFSASLAGIFFAQFAVGVLGSMFITAEYTTGAIRSTLAAVPRRTLLVVSKVLVMVGALVVLSECAVFISFPIGQSILSSDGAPSLTLGSPGVLRALVFAGLYLTLLGGLGFGLGLVLRRTAWTIFIFVVILLIAPIIVGFLPSDWSEPIQRFLPNQQGIGMMSVNQATGQYPPLGCALLLLAYVAALIAVGTVLLHRRDA